MSKRKQTQTKNNKTDTSFLFPHTLHGKKYKKHKNFLSFDDKWQSYLEQYLETKNPDHLIEAIRENNSLLQGKGRNLKYEEYGIQTWESIQRKSQNEPDPLYVDGHTIVWTTIRWWQELYNFLGDEEQAKEAKRYLHRIGDALTPPRKERRELSTGDGFIHVTPKEEGKKPYLTYESADKFVKYWNRAKSAFKGKKHYRSKIMPLLNEVDQYHRGLALVKQMDKPERKEWKRSTINDIRGIIEKKLGDEISENEVIRFNLQDIGTITASYITWKHEKGCPICQPKGNRKVGYKTIQRLIKEAEQHKKT